MSSPPPTHSPPESTGRSPSPRAVGFEQRFRLAHAWGLWALPQGMAVGALFGWSSLPLAWRAAGIVAATGVALAGGALLAKLTGARRWALMAGYLVVWGLCGAALYQGGISVAPRWAVSATAYCALAVLLLTVLCGVRLLSAAKAMLLASTLVLALVAMDQVVSRWKAPPVTAAKFDELRDALWWGVGVVSDPDLGWTYRPQVTIKTCYPSNPRQYFQEEPIYGRLDNRMWSTDVENDPQLTYSTDSAGALRIESSDKPRQMPRKIPKGTTSEEWERQSRERVVAYARLEIDQGKEYALSFRARADQPLAAGVTLQQARAPYGMLGLQREIRLGPQWRRYRMSFRASQTDSYAKLRLALRQRSGAAEVMDLEFTPLRDPSRGAAEVHAARQQGGGSPPGSALPMDRGLLPDGGYWRAEGHDGAAARWAESSDEGSDTAHHSEVWRCDDIKLAQVKPIPYSLTASLGDVRLEAGTKHVISLRARADSSRVIGLSVSQNHAPWESLGFYRDVRLSTQWQWIRYEFTATAREDRGRVLIAFGQHDVPFEIAEMRLAPLVASASEAQRWGPADWHLETAQGHTAEVQAPADDPQAVRIVQTGGSPLDSWRVQLMRQPLTVRANRRYELTFRARADAPRKIFVMAGQSAPPWNNVGLGRDIELGTAWEVFHLPFTCKQDEAQARLAWAVAAVPVPVEIADPNWRDVTDAPPERNTAGDGPSLARWQLSLQEGALATLRELYRPEQPADEPLWRIEPQADQPGSQAWHAQLVHPGLSQQSGREIRFKLRARADRPRIIELTVLQNHAPWQALGMFRKLQLTSDWQEFQFAYTPEANEADGRVQINFGGDATAWELALPAAEVSAAEPAAPSLAVTTGDSAGQTTEVPADSAKSVTRPLVRHTVSYTMNSAGYRDLERSVAAEPGVVRIACLGDSFTFGQGVKFEHMFTQRLEAMLNAQPPAGTRYEVLNFGVCGWSSEQEVTSYQKVAKRYQPRIVLQFMVDNDDESYQQTLSQKQAAGEREAEQVFQAWRLLAERARGEGRHDYGRCVRAVKELDRLCRADGVKFAPIIFRFFNEGSWRELVDVVTAGLAGSKIPLLDLGPPLMQGRSSESLSVYPLGTPPLDMHPNELAHEMAAIEVARFLMQQTWIAEASLPEPEAAPAISTVSPAQANPPAGADVAGASATAAEAESAPTDNTPPP